jgi:hypothetical protein
MKVQGCAASIINTADSGSSEGSMMTTATAKAPNARYAPTRIHTIIMSLGSVMESAACRRSATRLNR